MKKKRTYRVWIAQVNQTYVDVKSSSSDEAYEKAKLKWRREYAHGEVTDCQAQEEPSPDAPKGGEP